jgi:TRAP-type mannitol/chloroaromatic compound transport system substrate-binding protein
MTTQIVTDFGTLDEEQIKILKAGLQNMSDVLTMIDASRETLKEIVNSVHEEINVPKSLIKKMAKVYHKGTFAKVTAENSEFESIYEVLIQEQ